MAIINSKLVTFNLLIILFLFEVFFYEIGKLRVCFSNTAVKLNMKIFMANCFFFFIRTFFFLVVTKEYLYPSQLIKSPQIQT